MDMTTQKVFHALIEEEFQIQGARVGKRDQKAGQTPTGAADGDFAEMGPVHLSLLARKRAESQKGLLVNRSQASYHASQLHNTSGITALPDHLVDARGTHSGILLQGLPDGLYGGVGHYGTKSLGTSELLGAQRRADGVW